MRAATHDIFRSSGCQDEGEEVTRPITRTPSPPSHRAIFRRPKQTYSPSENSGSGSSEEPITTSLPHGPSWPPLTIPESESADTSKLSLSRPIKTGSSVSRQMEINVSTSSEREHRRKPSYYKIHMKNGLAKLDFGDDSSVKVTDGHNDRILLTPIKERNRLNRAAPIMEASSSSPSSSHSPGSFNQKWEVLENGQIVANPATPTATPSSSQGCSPRRVTTRTPKAPRKPFIKRSKRTPPRTPNTMTRSSVNRNPDSPPELQKSSFDTLSTDASSSDNSFYNEMLDLAQPTSPPRMDRMSCPREALFGDGSKGSLDFSSSKTSSHSQRSSSRNEKYTEFQKNKKDNACSTGFISQLIDFLSIGPCCKLDSICRDSKIMTSCG
jgi:hypothetical protein